MKNPRRLLQAGLLVLSCTASLAVERLPIEDFTRDPVISRARLSPDGRHLAFLRNFIMRPTLYVRELGTDDTHQFDLGNARLKNNAEKSVAAFQWIGSGRLAVTTAVWGEVYGVIATDWDGRRTVPLSGFEDPHVRVEYSDGPVRTIRPANLLSEIIHSSCDQDNSILMLDRHQDGGGAPNRPDIVRVNTLTGGTETVLKNPGEVTRYGLDADGVARLGILSHGALSGAIYRPNAQAAWRTILPLERRDGEMQPLGFDRSSDRVLVANLNPDRRWAIYALNPADGRLSEPLLSDREYDILPERFVPTIDGIALAGPLFSRAGQNLVGIRYYTEAARTKWLDRDHAKYQAIVDRALPDTVNLFVDESADGRKLLWFACSDQDPGSYHLLDLDKKSVSLLARGQPWIVPAKMAPMLAVKYLARDGLVIHGYLTVPVGRPPKGLPLVVLPHGGPWVRDVWGYDPLVQLLANRGYAVLQVNYRGSTGYGDELYRNARRQIGGKIQDDIEDATRWAIAAGVADPQRIAIMGASYGGYSALFALGHNPGLYRCGISLAGVTDWPAMFEDSDVAENRMAREFWREQIGDPDKNDLRAVSPVAFADQITAPVLILQGKEDQRVPPDQARRMVAALERAGRKPESRFIAGLDHTYGGQKQRTELFEAITAFLEKNLGPGAP